MDKFGYQRTIFYIQKQVLHSSNRASLLSPLSPILANIFLCHSEENWLKECPIEFKPHFYRRYVDGFFICFESTESAHSFREYMLSKDQNIHIRVKHKELASLSFLRCRIVVKVINFAISISKKPTLNRVFLNYESFIPT